MARTRLEELVREFAQNGFKLLLENPRNVQDVLALTKVKVRNLIDFDQMTRVRTTFVQREYRHIEADVVLRAPLRQPGKRGRRHLTIYILIEHQSEPDALMPFRVLEYVVQVYKAQVREWDRTHDSLAGLRFQPVLPVVLYTGTRRWDSLGRVRDLVEMGEELKEVMPELAPLFLNLSVLPATELETAGGFFGWVLRLVQQRKAPTLEFQQTLRRVVEHLELLPAAERLRWLELLSYIHALVYHERNRAEHTSLQEEIETSVQTDEHRREVSTMGKTIAQDLMEKGWKKGEKAGERKGAIKTAQETLLSQLRLRFGALPATTVAAVEATPDINQLKDWLNRFATATSLADVGIR